MSSNTDFVQYVCEQCSGAASIDVGSTSVADIYAKKMFGDYTLYCDGKVVGLVCDNNLYIKPTDAGRRLLKSERLRPPYEGAKDYFYVEEVDDHNYLSALVKATAEALLLPKSKRKKQ